MNAFMFSKHGVLFINSLIINHGINNHES
jgi:hypothetical protein